MDTETRRAANEWWASLSLNQMKAECQKHNMMYSLVRQCRGFLDDLWIKAGRPLPQECIPVISAVKTK